ncbi:ferredoxin [Ovoidimarina sediminis]|uniref:ferredoxin n=1 Tax=Ovoidimarina sediminis TaxID=3079856 RepID=UPI00290FE8F1|nr:ferredoxin [Rhodophyticola sp. MJ-SS7]MDU8946316.1 ferredoxin [Rhodophyticola sp. MJ-SS7]
MNYAALEAKVRAAQLDIFGAFHPAEGDGLPSSIKTLVLLGPGEPGFWPHLLDTPEWADGQPDAVDRWSRRVIGTLACDLGGKAYFPFSGPPWHPFIAWARRSGRAWESPVTLLVNDRAGLMVSYRGALGLGERLALPQPGPRPCDTCDTRPCLSACPVTALTTIGYDIPACKGYLSTEVGKESCMAKGCAVRRACPISETYGRLEAQSAYHMSHFAR